MGGASARFRPVFLTAVTTFVGLTPIMLERSAQAAFVIPMAISLAFGVAFATVITLFLVPCLSLVLDDLRELFARANEPAQPRPVVAGSVEQQPRVESDDRGGESLPTSLTG